MTPDIQEQEASAVIDAIHYRTIERGDHRCFDVAHVWIGGVPFSADLTPSVEATVKRIAECSSIEVSDFRQHSLTPEAS